MPAVNHQAITVIAGKQGTGTMLNVEYLQFHARPPSLSKPLEAWPVQISKRIGIHGKPVTFPSYEIDLAGNFRRIGNQIRGAEFMRVRQKRSDNHVPCLGCHDRDAEVKKPLANFRFRVFKLVVKLASAYSNFWLYAFEEGLRVCRAVSAVMRKQQDINLALKYFAVTKKGSYAGILNVTQAGDVEAPLTK